MSATREEMNCIEARAYNDTARRMARKGVTLSLRQADRIGESGVAWLEQRLGMRCTETSEGLECEPGEVAS